MSAPNLYVFSRTYEAGTAVRNILDAHAVTDMEFKTDKLGTCGDGTTIVLGFWWRGYVADEEELAKVRTALDEAGHPWFRKF